MSSHLHRPFNLRLVKAFGERRDRRSLRSRRGRGSSLARLEPLEPRQLLTTVTTAADVTDPNDGLVSLREAIEAANANPGAETIDFDASLSGTPILLSQGQLTVNDDLTITGLGMDETVLDAQGTSRVLEVSGDIDVTLSDLTVTGGSTAGDGGGILNNGDTLSLFNTTVSGNSAGGDGGGIFNGFLGASTSSARRFRAIRPETEGVGSTTAAGQSAFPIARSSGIQPKTEEAGSFNPVPSRLRAAC